MKKVLLSVLTLLVSMVGFADEALVGIVPLKLDAADAVAGKTGVLQVYLVNEGIPNATAASFRLYDLPAGMELTGTSATLAERGTALGGGLNKIATASTANSTNGYYYTITIAGGVSSTGVVGTSGVIATLPYKITSDLAPGVYAIRPTKYSSGKISNTAIYGTTDGVSLVAPSSVSYIIVGDGGTKSLTFTKAAELPSFVAEELNKEAKVTTLDMSPITAVHGTYGIVDGRTVTAPTAGLSVSKVSYFRPAGSNKYGTVNLPWAATGSFYTWDGTKNEKKEAHMVAASSLDANTTALISTEADFLATSVDGSYTIESDANPTEQTRIDATAGECEYYLQGDCLYRVNGYCMAPKYRGIFNFGATEVKGYYFDETGINGIKVNGEYEGVYDLSGRKLNKTTKGINIVNGKKQLVK